MAKTELPVQHDVLKLLLRLISPGQGSNVPLPDENQWDQLEYLSRFWHVAPSLWLALRGRAELQALDPDRQVRLRQGYVDNLRRNAFIRADVVRIARLINSDGITPVLLKGVAVLFDPRTADPAERYMHDIDLLVPEDQAVGCFDILKRAGFAEVPGTCSRHHKPALVDPQSGLEVEIHNRPHRLASAAEASSFVEDANFVTENGASLKVPADHHRIILNVFHAQVSDDGLSHAYFDPKQLLEFALYCQFIPAEAFQRAYQAFSYLPTVYLSWAALCRIYFGIEPPFCPPLRYRDRIQANRISARSTFGRGKSRPVDTAARLFIQTKTKMRSWK